MRWGWAPRRIVPPISDASSRCSTAPASVCHSVISATTGCGVFLLNSVLIAPSSPARLRAASITATCMPRQMPRYGMPFSRANRTVSILPSMPRSPKPPGYNDAVHVTQAIDAVFFDITGFDVVNLDLGAGVNAAVLQCFDQRNVRVLQVHVLADHRDVYFGTWILFCLDDGIPFAKVSGWQIEPHWRATISSRPCSCIICGILYKSSASNAEITAFSCTLVNKAIFLRCSCGSGFSGATNQDVWLDANRAQLFDRVLCWLGLDL